MNISHNRYWQEREFLLELLDNIPYYIFWKNRDSIFMGCNRLFAETANLKNPQDIVGKSDYDLPWSKENSNLYRDADKSVMDSGQAQLNIEELQIQPNGSTKVLLTSKVPLFDEKNTTIGILGIYTDITDRKEMEKQLIGAKEVAEQANQAKTDFLSNMSHDIKTPLSGLIGMTEILVDRLDGKNKEYGIDILSSGRKVMNFFSSCLTLIKQESGVSGLHRENFSLLALKEEVQSLFQSACRAKQLSFNVSYDNNIPLNLFGHKEAIYRILLNLLGNAIKFTESGHVSVNFKLGSRTTDKIAMIKITVKDSGTGIPKDKHKFIFEKFSRLTPSYQGQFEGSGIGLYMVDKLVASIGGQITLDSEEGVGSSFTVVLPVDISFLDISESDELSIYNKEPENIESPSLTAAKNNLTEKTKKGLKVLCVEDNEVAQKIMAMIFAKGEWSLDVASNGNDALNLFSPGKYDLIYLDIGLPDMSGYTLSNIFRRLENESKGSYYVPIIALTAHVDLDADNESYGLDALLNKPLTIEKNNKVIERFIYKKPVEVEGIAIICKKQMSI